MADNLVWLPDPEDRLTFRADPFALWHEGKLHIFVEHFDHRDLKGRIELLLYGPDLTFIGSEIVLSEPWHLSYPFLFRADSDVFMLPEARRSGELTLYRAANFPRAWEPIATIEIARDGLDATILFLDGRWWLFYGVVRRGRERSSHLNVAFAERLDGRWRAHPMNPVRQSFTLNRPAGTPIVNGDGTVDLPMQDGSRTYGGAVRRFRILRLTETLFEAEDMAWLAPTPVLAPFVDGLHTISAAGDLSLIDCKFIDRTVRGTLTWRRGRLAEKRRERKFGLPKGA